MITALRFRRFVACVRAVAFPVNDPVAQLMSSTQRTSIALGIAPELAVELAAGTHEACDDMGLTMPIPDQPRRSLR